jgi:hypothetical protein
MSVKLNLFLAVTYLLCVNGENQHHWIEEKPTKQIQSCLSPDLEEEVGKIHQLFILALGTANMPVLCGCN